MFFKQYAPYFELGGLLMAVLEFLGFGMILQSFVSWQGRLFLSLNMWFDEETEIKMVKAKINNVNYFYILFTLISLYILFVKISLSQYVMTTWDWVFLVVGYIGLYFFIWKILLPVLRFMLALSYWILGILVNRGVMTIIGLLMAVTSFIVSSTISTPPQPVDKAAVNTTEQPLKAEVGKVSEAKK